MASISAKICGLKTRASVDVAVENGAAYVGAVFFPKSPRAVTPVEAADLFADLPASVKLVGLFVDPDDALLRTVSDHVKLDLIQLHGSEAPERVAEIRKTFGIPVMKALAIETPDDLERAKAYETVSDMLLFDAKAPKSMKDALPGGNGLSFDWTMPASQRFALPWMLAGGLTADNVQEAVRISGATSVDTSSGVEQKPGIKDLDEIARFLKAVHQIKIEG